MKDAISKVLIFMVIFFFSIQAFSPIVLAQNSPPTLSRASVTPSYGRPDIEYLYTVTYTDVDNDPPAEIKVYIDQVEYSMEEVDPADTNYDDGKGYFFRKVMSEGTYTIYYYADDGHENTVNSHSFSLSVTWDVGHYDIIHFIEEKVYPGLLLLLAIIFIILIILCMVSISMVLQLRKIAKGLEEEKVEEMGEEVGKEGDEVESEEEKKIY